MGGSDRREAWRGVLFAAVFASASLAATGSASALGHNLLISSGATTGVTVGAGTFTANADNAVLNVTALNNALGTGDVVVSTGSGGSQAGEITVGAAVSWSSARELTLSTADDDVVLVSPISASDPGGSLTLEAAGAILQNSTGQISIAGPTSLTASLGVTLDQANNDFGGSLSIQSAPAESKIKDANALALGTVSIGGGTIEAAGPLTQTGPITSGGELSVLSGNTVALANPGNDFDKFKGSAIGLGVRDANALELTGFTALVASLGAGTDLSITNPVNSHFANSVTLTADTAAGSAVGPGGIEIAPGVGVESNTTPLKIYTARRDQNSIGAGATLNGATFTPGPEFVDSATEVWNTASPNGTATNPFTIFYKQAKPVVAPPVDPLPPDTILTGKPKKKIKTKRKKVKVSFEFTSNVVGSTFTCALDGRAISCNSPFEAKVKKGRHTFSVAATAGGKIDPTPASFEFKVQRKRKHR